VTKISQQEFSRAGLGHGQKCAAMNGAKVVGVFWTFWEADQESIFWPDQFQAN
jgi:hypothetical protein